jgi:hypothetical protein
VNSWVWRLEMIIYQLHLNGSTRRNLLYECNILSVLRSIWLVRNDIIFRKQVWSSVKCILRKAMKILLDWEIIYKESNKVEMKKWLSCLEQLIRKPLRIENA